LGVTFAQQAEVLLADAVQTGTAKIVTDALCPYEFDRERAVDFGTVTVGQQLGQIELAVDSDTVYDVHIYTAPEVGIADLSLQLDGKTLPIVAHPQPNVLQLESIFLNQGEHIVNVVAATAGHAVLDCLQVGPVARTAGAIEAEEQAVVRATGGAIEPRPSDPRSGVSAGRVLVFHADKVGQGFVMQLGNRPSASYVLGVRPVVGPNAGMIQAFVADKPIGSSFDLYAPERGLGPMVLPLGPVASDVSEVEIRVVGRNKSSHGFDAEVDYMRWEPTILGAETAEGVWAQVVGMKGCDYRPQDLGPSYSGGHQFWVQPSSLQAWVDIAIEIPSDGSYEFVVKYTKSWDYASIQAFLDEQPLGPVVDTYAPAVVPAEPMTLGKLDLTAGRHVLRFQAVGNNPQSKGYLMGIDHVIVR
jgi:hypothetical protein